MSAVSSSQTGFWNRRHWFEPGSNRKRWNEIRNNTYQEKEKSDMAESTQHKLDRIRPPRVQITYDLETGGAIQKKEIPFVMGIMADLSGTKPAAKKLSDPERKFIEIDRDSFDSIMRSIKPTLSVPITHGGPTTLDLTFECMDDFMPLYWDADKRAYNGLVTRDTVMKEKFEQRLKLNNLLAKLDMKLEGAKTVGDVLLEGVNDLDKFNQDLDLFCKEDPLLAAENAEKEPEQIGYHGGLPVGLEQHHGACVA